ncbi:glutamate 5-kinase [Helicobacter sp. MIT 00-7814]|uniref:glutamate 5-kinase n=1 Tax=unclassified Helicobacter TaxID=2593540 RepID=UPI000E1EE8E5|nr:MULTISPECIES: glutamate 5-kinase [unclassified Helicobacter]RDU54605.1 glutamate 5-kinase [Helicobacter sp. MIT 00-7814]RDU54664.1 glutamate 5-kinase [Helicobacter sp. MIT 99-10781]
MAKNPPKKRVVLKFGSSILSDGNAINQVQIQNIARLVVELRARYDVLLVSSGAVASGYTRVKIDKSLMPNKQALASIGQPLLIESYRKEFAPFGVEIAQILLTGHNFDSRKQTKCAKDCVETLLAHGVLPIFNENDSTAVHEFIGDNDRLGAFVAHYFDAEILAILSDIDGYFESNPKKNPHAKILSRIQNIESSALEELASPNAHFATGGIVTKLQAAQFLLERGKAMFLSNGSKLEVVKEFLLNDNQISGSLFKRD